MNHNPQQSEPGPSRHEMPVEQSIVPSFGRRVLNLVGFHGPINVKSDYSRAELQELEEEFSPGVAQLLKGVAHSWGKKVVLNDNRTTPDARF